MRGVGREVLYNALKYTVHMVTGATDVYGARSFVYEISFDNRSRLPRNCLLFGPPENGIGAGVAEVISILPVITRPEFIFQFFSCRNNCDDQVTSHGYTSID